VAFVKQTESKLSVTISAVDPLSVLFVVPAFPFAALSFFLLVGVAKLSAASLGIFLIGLPLWAACGWGTFGCMFRTVELDRRNDRLLFRRFLIPTATHQLSRLDHLEYQEVRDDSEVSGKVQFHLKDGTSFPLSNWGSSALSDLKRLTDEANLFLRSSL
jgi:hypothetical protein